MTSEAPAECFVYITLPGETVPVTAGRYALAIDRRGVPEGRFVYGRSYLARPNAVAFDPVELKLAPRTYRTAGGIFGALRDASPDYWGRRIIQQHLRKAQPGEMEYLLYSPDDRAGALGFGLNQTPPAPKRAFNRTLDLATMQAIADAIVAGEDAPLGVADADHDQIERLIRIGTSMGGARPKAVVEDDEGLWVAKFNRPDDMWNNARVEHAMLVLARACGAAGYRRSRMVSALTLLRAEDTYQSRDKWSYVLLAEELRRVCVEPKQATTELFRRMCFNALISNTDDHPRNHAVIAREVNWNLSPAYDLTPTTPVSMDRRDLAMACGDAGRFANAGNLLSQSARFLLDPDEARVLIDTMEAQIRSGWYATARAAGVAEHDCKKIAPAFAYPGFRQPTTT